MLILELNAAFIHMLENTKTAFINSFTEQQQQKKMDLHTKALPAHYYAHFFRASIDYSLCARPGYT